MKRGAAWRGPLLGFVASLLLPLGTSAQTSPPGLSQDHTSVTRPATDKPYAAGRVMVKFTPEAAPPPAQEIHLSHPGDPGLGHPSLDALNAEAGVTLIQPVHGNLANTSADDQIGLSRWFALEVDPAADIVALAAQYEADPAIERATPDYEIFPTATPNDPLYASHWGHSNAGQFRDFCRNCGGHAAGSPVGTPGFDADADGAWDEPQGYGDPSVVIAIVDTGVDLDHPDLRLVPGYDFGDDDNDPDDDAANSGHGTACAGLAAARADNGVGTVGVAGGCSVMPVKIANRFGSMFLSALQSGLVFAADQGADIISMSIGVAISTDPATDDAIAYAHNSGAILLAASGNRNDDEIDYPASRPQVLAVGAASPCGGRKRSSSSSAGLSPATRTDPLGVTCDGEFWWGSNYGSNSPDAADAIDILGPTILPTTDVLGSGGLASGDYHPYFNGTSAATPYVAGVFALVLSANPNLSRDDAIQQVLATARDVVNAEAGAGWDRYSGYGLVNAAIAVGGGSVQPTLPYATLPYSNDFESGVLGNEWAIANTNDGRTLVSTANGPHGGSHHLTLDDASVGGYTQNEAWLRLDLTGESNVNLDFWLKDFGEEDHPEDGIYFSQNGGLTFVRVMPLDSPSLPNGVWQPFHLDLDALAAANGVSLTGTFVVKFQQYDNRPIPSDGIAIDDIFVTAATGTPGSVTLTAPNGGEVLQVSSSTPITWTSTGSVTSVDLDFSIDGGLTWIPIVAGTANDGTEDWLVPGAVTTQGRVRVSANGGFLTDSSDGNFTIDSTPPPPAPEDWATPPYATGFESGNLDSSWRTASTEDGRVRILGTDSPRGAFQLAMDDETRGGYSQNEASLLLDLSATPRAELSFWWKDFGDETHPEDGVYFSDDGGTTFVKAYDMNPDGLSNDTWHQTTLDVDQIATAQGLSLSNTFVVKFQQYDNYPMISDGICIDDVSITVPAAPTGSLTVTAPNGGETLTVGSVASVTWTSTGSVANVRLEYSGDGGTTWTTITASTPNDGSHDWTVPEAATILARVRVTDVAEPTITDVSDADFTIEHDVTPPPSGDYAALPYTTGFEQGSLDGFWTTASSNEGRIQVTSQEGPATGNFHLTMDDHTRAGAYSLNEARLHLNLGGESEVTLECSWKEYGDESHSEDGVFFSDDGGATFTKVYDLNGSEYGNGTWRQLILDVDDLATAAGLNLSETFVVKFQQYDNYSIASDGHAYDDVMVTVDGDVEPPPDDDDPPAGNGNGITAEAEPNDTSPFASGPVVTNAVSGAIDSANDVDWFYFDMTVASTALIELAIDGAADLDVYLYDSAMNEVARAYTTNNPESMSVFMIRDQYFLKVSGYRGAMSPYTLTLSGAGISKTGEEVPQVRLVNALHQNVPNPFNPQTSISFELARSGPVRLSIYNLRGQRVAVLVDEFRKAGPHSIVWNGRDSRGGTVSSGVYVYRLETQGFDATRKMILTK